MRVTVSLLGVYVCACSRALEMLLCLLTRQELKSSRPLLSSVCPAELLLAPALWGPPLTPRHFSTRVETDRKRERRTQKGEPGIRFKAKPDAKGKVCVWARASPWWQPWVSSYSGGIRLLKESELKQNTRVCRNLIAMQAEKRSKAGEGQRQKEEPHSSWIRVLTEGPSYARGSSWWVFLWAFICVCFHRWA